jgi:YfiH family protein
MDLSNDNMIHIKKDGIEYLQFKKLLEYEDILTHVFTLSPLDFGNYDIYKDNKEQIIENYKKICKALELDHENIVRPIQLHSHNIKTVNKIGIYEEEYKNVDGLITNKKDQILSLTYADCIPLYFFDPNKKVIANIHSGWQGTLQRIGALAVEKLINEYNCNPKDLICAIRTIY